MQPGSLLPRRYAVCSSVWLGLEALLRWAGRCVGGYARPGSSLTGRTRFAGAPLRLGCEGGRWAAAGGARCEWEGERYPKAGGAARCVCEGTGRHHLSRGGRRGELPSPRPGKGRV